MILANFAESAAQNGMSDIDCKRVVLWIGCQGWCPEQNVRARP
jgi:hypothetical protein